MSLLDSIASDHACMHVARAAFKQNLVITSPVAIYFFAVIR